MYNLYTNPIHPKMPICNSTWAESNTTRLCCTCNYFRVFHNSINVHTHIDPVYVMANDVCLTPMTSGQKISSGLISTSMHNAKT